MSAATARADTAATDNHDAGVSPVTVLVEKLSARPVTGDTFNGKNKMPKYFIL